MDQFYTLNELALMTGLTTRTLRNYLKMNVLCGEKIDGIWQFTAEDISAFISNPTVKPSIEAKRNAAVYDFMLDRKKTENEICSILDLRADNDEAQEISVFFCNAVNQYEDEGHLHFSFEKSGEHVRVILNGYEEPVMEILNRFYQVK